MFGIIVLLSNIVDGSNHTKCVSIRNQKCMVQLNLINLHPNEYSEEFHYYPSAVKLDSCVKFVIILLMTYLIKYVFKKNPEDLNLRMFNMTAGMNELKH